MMQVVAWFVAGVAWPWLALVSLVLFAIMMERDESKYVGFPGAMVMVALWLLSSGVAVAATAVALGVGR